MAFPLRTTAGLLAACALTVGALARVSAQDPAPATPPCVRALIALIDPVSSANARAGDSFRFRIVDAATAPDGTAIPAGNIGYGVVAFASHAARGGVGGYLALEPRFIRLENGTRIDVYADRLTTTTSARTGSSNNAPFALGVVPFAGYLLGPYGYLHHGSDTTLPVGTRLSVLVGEQLALGECHIPAANETPAPPAKPQARPSPAGEPSPSAPASGEPSPGV